MTDDTTKDTCCENAGWIFLKDNKKMCQHGCHAQKLTERSMPDHIALPTSHQELNSLRPVDSVRLAEEDTLDAMIRDFTSVAPRAKSEVRRRMDSLLTTARTQAFKEAGERVRKDAKEWRLKQPQSSESDYLYSLATAIEEMGKKQ